MVKITPEDMRVMKIEYINDNNKNSILTYYRYGYNGMEKDDEVSQEGNSYTTQFRQLNVRIGRWFSMDSLKAKFPWQSPYVSMDNNPIFLVDPSGLAAGDPPSDDGSNSGEDISSDEGNSSFDGWKLMQSVNYSYTRTKESTIFTTLSGKPITIPEGLSVYTLNGDADIFGLSQKYIYFEDDTDYSSSGSNGSSYTQYALTSGALIFSAETIVEGVAVSTFASLGVLASPLLLSGDTRQIGYRGTGVIPKVLGTNYGSQQSTLYTLNANISGSYPYMVFGQKTAFSHYSLNKGDIWKIGESMNPNRRYTRSQMARWNVTMRKWITGPRSTIKAAEVFWLINYTIENGDLPLGNKMLR